MEVTPETKALQRMFSMREKLLIKKLILEGSPSKKIYLASLFLLFCAFIVGFTLYTLLVERYPKSSTTTIILFLAANGALVVFYYDKSNKTKKQLFMVSNLSQHIKEYDDALLGLSEPFDDYVENKIQTFELLVDTTINSQSWNIEMSHWSSSDVVQAWYSSEIERYRLHKLTEMAEYIERKRNQ